MKRITTPIIKTALYSITLIAAMITYAEKTRVEATSITTTSTGTVSEFGPQAIVISTKAGSKPVRYISNETTNYVDEKGNPVSAETVKSGLPVTVYYTKIGDTLMASKVMVRKENAGAAGEVVEDKIVIEQVPPHTVTSNSQGNGLAGNVTVVNTAGQASEKSPEGFVMSNGHVYAVSDGQVLPLTREFIFRVTPSGFIGFDGQSQMLPDGAMFSSTGIVMAAPSGLRDVNGNVFGMQSTNTGATNNNDTSNAQSSPGVRRTGNSGNSGGNTGSNFNNGNVQFGFIPVNGNGTSNANGVPTANIGTQTQNSTQPQGGTRSPGTNSNGTGSQGGGAASGGAASGGRAK